MRIREGAYITLFSTTQSGRSSFDVAVIHGNNTGPALVGKKIASVFFHAIVSALVLSSSAGSSPCIALLTPSREWKIRLTAFMNNNIGYCTKE